MICDAACLLPALPACALSDLRLILSRDRRTAMEHRRILRWKCLSYLLRRRSQHSMLWRTRRSSHASTIFIAKSNESTANSLPLRAVAGVAVAAVILDTPVIDVVIAVAVTAAAAAAATATAGAEAGAEAEAEAEVTSDDGAVGAGRGADRAHRIERTDRDPAPLTAPVLGMCISVCLPVPCAAALHSLTGLFVA